LVTDTEAYNKIFFNQTEITAAILVNNNFNLDQVSILASNNIVRLCSANSYKFDMLGLFQQSQQIEYIFTFDKAVTEIRIELNFLSLLANTKF
jgi:hypothetical protein